MNYLIIGASICLIFGCRQHITVDCHVKGRFIYYNETDHIVEIPIGKINPQDSLIAINEGLGSCQVTAKNYVPPFIGITTITFNDTLCLTFKAGSNVGNGEGPAGIHNYSNQKIDDRYYEFTYSFIKEDFKNAEPCE